MLSLERGLDHVSRPSQTAASVDTLRVVAFTLLVSYHVIGSSSRSGLEIAYPHVMRLYADYLIGIRMPIFAVIAGYVYALRPVKLPNYPGFFTGKLRRLFVPGAVAAFAFMIAGTIVGNIYGRSWSESWTVVVYSYAHYWYLQAMLVIFVAAGLIDGLLKGRGTLLLWAVALALTLSGLTINTTFMSLNRIFDLLPHFMTGIVVQRYWTVLWHHRWTILVACMLVIGWHLVAQIQFYEEHGVLIRNRRALVSVLFSTAGCVLLMLYMPRLRALDILAPFAFTIYLYHVLGTAGMRELLHWFGIYSLTITAPLGLMAGICFPIVVHLAADRMPMSRKLVLGKRS